MMVASPEYRFLQQCLYPFCSSNKWNHYKKFDGKSLDAHLTIVTWSLLTFLFLNFKRQETINGVKSA